MSEEALQAFCGRLLTGGGEVEDEDLLAADDELAREVTARLGRCGVRLVRAAGEAPLCVVAASGDDLPELALACLALCALALQGAGSRKRARVSVREIWERVGHRSGYTEPYVRRAGLGPLEARGLIRVTKPAQRATEAYVTAGPALRAVDGEVIATRVRASRNNREVPA